jgi:hypothetical protein
MMTYVITYDASTRALVTKTAGRMNARDFIAMAEDILRHPRHVPHGKALFDHEDLDFAGVRVEDLQQIRAFHAGHESAIGNGKSAMLVRAGCLERWHQLWAQGTKIKTGNVVRVFEDRADAVRWLTE